MKIIKNVIYFKSYPEYYDKEVSGIKPNTVRIVDEEEDIEIQEFSKNIKDKFIEIGNPKTGDHFGRLLTDITRFEHPPLIIYIFSWG